MQVMFVTYVLNYCCPLTLSAILLQVDFYHSAQCQNIKKNVQISVAFVCSAQLTALTIHYFHCLHREVPAAFLCV